MKRVVAVLIASLVLINPVEAQKKKRPAPKARPKSAQRPATQKTPASAARSIGAHVQIVTRNGDRLSGELLDLNAYSIKIRSEKLESSIPLDSVASLSFGDGSSDGGSQQTAGQPSADFSRDAAFVLRQFGTVASNLKSGIDYGEFKQQAADLRRSVDRIVVRYAGTESVAELRVLSLLIAGSTDYDWSRSIWTLKFGRSSDGLAYDAESPELAAALSAYADLKTAASSGSKYAVEKVISGLWQKAAEKAERARSMIATSR